jgi:colanic acid/amylovoran biosynthesis glycosyltransferase
MSVHAVHIFNHYLPQTVNWAYNMISNMPEVRSTIASPKFAKTNFYSPSFQYIQYPLQSVHEAFRRTSGIEKIKYYAMLKVGGSYETFLYDNLKRQKVDLIHAHFAHVACRYLNVARKLQVPYVVSFYGLDYEHKPFVNPKLATQYKNLYQHADMFLCEGDHGASILAKAGCPVDKIKVAKLGVEIPKIEYISRPKTPGRLRLVQIASMKEKKGHVYAVRAFAEAARECPNMNLTFVGGGDKEIELEVKNVIAAHNLEDKVTLIRSIEYAKLYQFLTDFDVFIHPSVYTSDRNCEGGAPVVLLDAQATGMPVISTLHCDIPSEVIDRKTGLLTPERDVQAMAKSISEFYHMDQATYSKFAESSRKHVSEQYDIRQNALIVQGYYKSLLK